jgi:aspartate ammonia-lyase
LEKSTAYATLLTPKLGYDKVSELVKEALKTNRTIREIVIKQKLLTNKEFDVIVNSFKP